LINSAGFHSWLNVIEVSGSVYDGPSINAGIALCVSAKAVAATGNSEMVHAIAEDMREVWFVSCCSSEILYYTRTSWYTHLSLEL
jgi:hypothetical protein